MALLLFLLPLLLFTCCMDTLPVTVSKSCQSYVWTRCLLQWMKCCQSYVWTRCLLQWVKCCHSYFWTRCLLQWVKCCLSDVLTRCVLQWVKCFPSGVLKCCMSQCLKCCQSLLFETLYWHGFACYSAWSVSRTMYWHVACYSEWSDLLRCDLLPEWCIDMLPVAAANWRFCWTTVRRSDVTEADSTCAKSLRESCCRCHGFASSWSTCLLQ